MVKYNLLFVGTGGTGTYVLKEFSRYLYHNEDILSKISSLKLVDGDVVEEKNLRRQAFSEDDIGYNKAVVMADVLNQIFDLAYKAYGKYILSVSDIEDMFSGNSERKHVNVLVGCVDNHGARMDMEEYFYEKACDCVYIDAANELCDGECVVAVKYNGHVISPCRSHYWPEIKQNPENPEKGRPDRVDEMSCEALNVSSPQHILANMNSALCVLSYLIQLLEKGTVSGGFSTFNVFAHHGREYPFCE